MRLYSAEKTYNLIDATDCSHPIVRCGGVLRGGCGGVLSRLSVDSPLKLTRLCVSDSLIDSLLPVLRF